MNILFYLLMLVVLFNTACSSSKIQGDNTAHYQKLSYELECSQKPSIVIPSNNGTSFNVDQIDKPIEVKNIHPTKKNSSFFKIESSKKDPTEKKIHPTKLQSPKKQHLFRVDKESIFWKIAVILTKAGLIALSIFGGVVISVNNYGGTNVFLGGFIIGLSVLALSIPFYLLAIITTYMRDRAKPMKDANEI